MRRAVTRAAVRADPSRVAGRRVVGDELAGRRDDDEVVDQQRRRREAPVGHLGVAVGAGIARPDDTSGGRIEHVEDAGRAEGVDASVAERRRASRTRAAVRFPEPRLVTMLPHRRAGADAIRGDDLVLAALLLRVEHVAVDGKRRPARTDRPAPQFLRRRRRPIGGDAHAANDAVAIAAAEARPVGEVRRVQRVQRVPRVRRVQRVRRVRRVRRAGASGQRRGCRGGRSRQVLAACRRAAPVRDLQPWATIATRDRCRRRP